MGALQANSRIIDRYNVPNADAGDRILSVFEELGVSALQRLSVEELARRCGCSRRHLSRLVLDRLGRSVMSLKNQLRLEKAATLLLASDEKVSAIAIECGFNHLGSFTAQFKARFGTTPARWRERVWQQKGQGTPTRQNGYSLRQASPRSGLTSFVPAKGLP